MSQTHEPLVAKKAVLGLLLARSNMLANMHVTQHPYVPRPEDFRELAHLVISVTQWTESELKDHFFRVAINRNPQSLSAMKDWFNKYRYMPEIRRRNDLLVKMSMHLDEVTWHVGLLEPECDPED